MRAHSLNPRDTVYAVEPDLSCTRRPVRLDRTTDRDKLTTATKAAELLATCVHETGHNRLATRLGLESRVMLGSAREGVCTHSHGDRLQTESICWAGIMAEDLTGYRQPSRSLPKAKLTPETFDAWVDEVLAAITGGDRACTGLSASDAAGIAIVGRSYAAKQAFNILARDVEGLRNDARRMAQLFEPVAVQAQRLTEQEVRASLGHPDTPRGEEEAKTLAGVLKRLTPLADDEREAQEKAKASTHEASRLSKDLRVLGSYAPARLHREAAKAHRTAASAWFLASELSHEVNTAAVAEFVACRERGDSRSAKHAARYVSALEPSRCEERGREHLDKADEHQRAAGGAA